MLLGLCFEFGPFVIAVLLLLMSSLAGDIPAIKKIIPDSRVGIYVCAAFVALLGFVLRLTSRQVAVERAVLEATSATNRAVLHLKPDIEALALAKAFEAAQSEGAVCEHIRICAVKSRFISVNMQSDRLKAELLSLMVAESTSAQSGSRDLVNLKAEVQLIIEHEWIPRVRDGDIRSLRVRQYKFFPTEWYVIFDHRVMVLGTYVFNKGALGHVRHLDTVMLVHDTGAGRDLIRSKVAAFDRLFDSDVALVGRGDFDGDYALRDGNVARSGGDGKWNQLL